MKNTGTLFLSKNFLLIIPSIGQSVFAEAVFFTFQGLWFSVRARALGSFLSGIVAIIAGNLLGLFLDNEKLAMRFRGRWAFAVLFTLQGAWWLWGTIIVTDFRKSQPTYDWVDVGFGRGFAWFLVMVMWFQVNYMYLYFVIGSLAKNDAEVVRFAGLLRGTESAWQAISYGLTSVTVMGQVGGVYLNFGLCAVSLVPAWWVIREIGVSTGKGVDERSRGEHRE